MMPGVIERVREQKPEVYLQPVARLIPTQHIIDVVRRSITEMSSEKLLKIIRNEPIDAEFSRESLPARIECGAKGP